MGRMLRPLLLVSAFASLAAFLTGCVIVKPESLRGTQSGVIGPVTVEFELCSTNTFATNEACGPNSATGQAQQMLAVAVPNGTKAPDVLSASSNTGNGPPITYRRNQEVADAMAAYAATQAFPWPPAGLEVVGYLSDPAPEFSGALQEWRVSGDFGLPGAPDGGSFGGPFEVVIAWGWRPVSPEAPASRPVQCDEEGMDTYCHGTQQVQLGVSDLKIVPPDQIRALAGGTATLPFTMDFASSTGTSPAFALSASATLPGAVAAPSGPTYVPGPVGPSANRAAPAAAGVAVTVPRRAKPGTYDVTITATAPGGGTVSQTAKLQVAKPRLGLGKLTLNRGKGTATLQVKVFEAGTVTVLGKKVAKVKRSAKGRKTLKVLIRAKGKAKKALGSTGRAKVRAKVRFKPSNGAAVTKSRAVTLVKAP